jgi:hypothetical protein
VARLSKTKRNNKLKLLENTRLKLKQREKSRNNYWKRKKGRKRKCLTSPDNTKIFRKKSKQIEKSSLL